MKSGWTGLLLTGLTVGFSTGCGPSYDNTLPVAAVLGSPRGYTIARTTTHFHSPISWDACDKNGLPDGVTPDPTCLADLKNALCKNKIDFMFLTDHPDHMTGFEFNQLLVPGPSDTLLYSGGVPYANQVGGCDGGFTPTVFPGFEGRLMALGMMNHVDPDPAVRGPMYTGETLDTRNKLRDVSGALVAIPHTESRTVSYMQALSPDAIEIYNFHANVDPKIRKTDLHEPPFQDLPGILTYLIDPYHELNADFMFMNFFNVNQIYFDDWDQLIAGGLKVTGIGGSDSHENVFKTTAADGERLDGHRRIARFMSNHYLVNSMDPASIKDAIKKGRGWVVIEGLGSPQGMDFYATVASTTIGVGETGPLSGGNAVITVKAPTLYNRSPRGTGIPIIRLELRKVMSDGTDMVVARSIGSDIQYATATPGAYRAEIYITPRHLEPFLGDFSDNADKEFRWIITNHLYLDP